MTVAAVLDLAASVILVAANVRGPAERNVTVRFATPLFRGAFVGRSAFGSLDAMVAQIHQDAAQARQLLNI